jgi:hypothetical protein
MFLVLAAFGIPSGAKPFGRKIVTAGSSPAAQDDIKTRRPKKKSTTSHNGNEGPESLVVS